MKLITKPEVYVVGRQTIDDVELDRFLQDHGVTWESDSEVAGEVLAETAGRLCYLSYAKPRPGGNSAYLSHIKESGHGSVLESAVWNLVITNVSRSLTHELVRHRSGFGYSQLSQRYVSEDVAEYVVPPDLQREVDAALWWRNDSGVATLEDDRFVLAGEEHDFFLKGTKYENYSWDTFQAMRKAGDEWLYAVNTSHVAYQKLSDYLSCKSTTLGLEKTEARKFARQAARSVLPNATETKIFVTANARALRHFLEMRGSRFADPEIRILANSILDVLKGESPNLFGDYRKEPLPDGTFEILTDYRKV